MKQDLFTPIVERECLHPAFLNILKRPNEHNRRVLEQWADGFVDRDGKFVKELQTTFDSSFWELYLFAALKELKLAPDFRFSRPDFCIGAPGDFLIEATVALHADGAPAVTDTKPIEMPREFKEFNREAIIRLSNSLHAKHQKYVDSYLKLPHVTGRPFVVAIAPFDRPHFQLQAQRAIEALLYRYYVDEDTYLREHPNREVPLVAEDLPYVTKASGGKIPLGLFCNDAMAGISAVIQSTGATWSKVSALGEDPDVMITAIYENRVEGGQYVYKGPNSRYSENILDGLRVYHNPFAAHPLDLGRFDRPEIFQASSRGPVQMHRLSEGRKILVNRASMVFPAGFMAEVVKDMPEDLSFWHYIP